MKVIGFQFTSSTSSIKKQYTVLVTEDGRVIRHWGGRNFTGGTFENQRGNVSVKTIPMQERSLREFLDKEFSDRQAKPEYDGLSFDFHGIDININGVTVGMSEIKVNTLARDITAAWLNTVASAYHNQFELSKHIKRDLSSEYRDIEKFARNGSNPNGFTAGATAAPAAKPAKVREYFTDFDEQKNGKKVLRPNGEEYKPREIMGHTDIALMRKFRETTIYFRLSGPPGAGKTAAVEGAFGDDLITVSGHGDMTVANFVGNYRPLPDGTWKWEDGPLTKAMRQGKVLFVDEGTRIPSEVLNVLFSVMDGRNMLRLDDRPDDPIVHATKGFFVCMGYNPDTLGARPLDEALVSRFRVQIDVETDHATAKSLGVPALALKIAANLRTRDKKDKANGGPGNYVPEMRELLTFRDLVKQGFGEDFALATLVASCPREMDRPALIDAIQMVAKTEVGIPSLGGLV